MATPYYYMFRVESISPPTQFRVRFLKNKRNKILTAVTDGLR